VLGRAGGAGILLYLALWAALRGAHRVMAIALVALAAAALLFALGFSRESVLGAALIVAGIAVAVASGGSLRPGGSVPIIAIVLLMIGAVTLLDHLGASRSLVGPGALAGALVLVLGPWFWQLATERADRIRLAE